MYLFSAPSFASLVTREVESGSERHGGPATDAVSSRPRAARVRILPRAEDRGGSARHHLQELKRIFKTDAIC